MSFQSNLQSPDTIGQSVVDDLTSRHGPMMGGKSLIQALGYTNGQAFRQAVRQGRIEVKVFNLRGRQGKFALTMDVAAWIKSVSEAQ